MKGWFHPCNSKCTPPSWKQAACSSTHRQSWKTKHLVPPANRSPPLSLKATSIRGGQGGPRVAASVLGPRKDNGLGQEPLSVASWLCNVSLHPPWTAAPRWRGVPCPRPEMGLRKSN